VTRPAARSPSARRPAVEPGRLIPAHLHDTEDEFTYVIDGRIGVLIGEEEFHPDLEQPLMDKHNVRVIGT
jgi:oxalate decarboxylase/phosphoglucose isomerase-like protein (cupin superfamily)